jgi:hypothetical protein
MVTYTENGALSKESTGDGRLDLFFKCVRDLVTVPRAEEFIAYEDYPALKELIEASWDVDPLDTMKILFNWRDCRGGKGDRRGFVLAMAYLSNAHPEWVLTNLHLVPEYGRYLDLVHLWHLSVFPVQILKLLTEQLKKDCELLKLQGSNAKVSLLAKWLPSENSKWDKFGNGKKFNTQLLKVWFNKKNLCSVDFKIYRRTVLVPLRKQIKIVETMLCERDYTSIEYEHVPSVAMNRYRNAFRKNDQERFADYLELVKSGYKDIKASQVYPHTLVKHYLDFMPLDEVVEEQWKQIYSEVSSSGVFENSISVVDVSGSMNGVPMQVAISLGLLSVNESNEHSVITFSESPTLHRVKGTTLEARVNELSRMDWGMNTDIEKVFRLLLSLAGKKKYIKRVFIFSDMQFDAAVINSDTQLRNAKALYAARKVPFPQIIFWNLRATTLDFPADMMEGGIALLSGYSPALLKAVLNPNPGAQMLEVLLQTIRSERYSKITAPIQKT